MLPRKHSVMRSARESDAAAFTADRNRGGGGFRRRSSGRPPSNPGSIRAFIARQGHWILALLLVVLVLRLAEHSGEVTSPGELPAVGRSAASVAPEPAAPYAQHLATKQSPVQRPLLPAAERAEDAPVRSEEEAKPGGERRDTSPEEVGVIVEPSENGAYYVKGTINQKDVVFLIDTGSSWISIPERLRQPLKLDRGRYVRVSTASGEVGNYETTIGELALGPLRFENVAGALNPYAPNDIVLLGMSALRDVRMTQEGGRLMLTRQRLVPGPPAAGPVPRPEELVMRRSLRECMKANQVIDRETVECMQGR